MPTPPDFDPSLYRCPVHHEPVRLEGDDLVGVTHALRYPILDGIPILLPDPAERERLRSTDYAATPTAGASTLDFYNQTRDHDQYCRSELDFFRDILARWVPEVKADGLTLEIGSGKGALQGLGTAAGYVALDYSFTALRKYIKPTHRRVCATAEQLPFPDASFAMVFTVAALEHVPKADLAFNEIHRILKPGGVAVLSPAWHCVQYNCDGIPVRPYKDLTWLQRWVKLTLPIRRNRLVKAMAALPARTARRAAWKLSGGGPARFRFKRLRPDYTTFWTADSDAASRLDAHEACLFYQSRHYQILAPGHGPLRQLTAGHGPVVVRKPG